MNMRQLIIATAIGTGTMFGMVGTAVHAAGDGADKQSVSEYASDTVITTKVKGALVADSTLSALDISVETTDATVVLNGSVGTEAQAEQAARIARDTEGVKQVQNNLKIDPSKAEQK